MISLQVGQCGNQVGLELYSSLCKEAIDNINTDYSRNVFQHFFRTDNKNGMFCNEFESIEKPVARAVMIDMEPKVIQATMHTAKKSGTWCYDNKRFFSKQSGSANNWAYGFLPILKK